MKILALADIHGQIQTIPRLSNAARDCDAIVLAGDITDFGGPDQAVSVLSAFSDLGIPVLGVTGNCDGPHVDDALGQQGNSLIQESVEINGFTFVGFPYSASNDSELNVPVHLTAISDNKKVLVTHQPAWGTRVDLQASTRHKGSRAVRFFIEDHQPVLAISGHIHEARGIDQIGSTVLVNPGPFRNGCYAVIDLSDGAVRPRLHYI